MIPWLSSTLNRLQQSMRVPEANDETVSSLLLKYRLAVIDLLIARISFWGGVLTYGGGVGLLMKRLSTQPTPDSLPALVIFHFLLLAFLMVAALSGREQSKTPPKKVAS